MKLTTALLSFSTCIAAACGLVPIAAASTVPTPDTVAVIQPGTRMHRNDVDGPHYCTVGPMALAGNTLGFFTAGHCGDVGDTAYITLSNGSEISFGHYILDSTTQVKTINMSRDKDYAFIAIDNAPGISYDFHPKGFENYPIDPSAMTNTDYNIAQPVSLIIGGKSGISAGDYTKTSMNYVGSEFYALRDHPVAHGDSGGPMFTLKMRTNTLKYIGIASNINEDPEESYVSSFMLDDAMKQTSARLITNYDGRSYYAY